MKNKKLYVVFVYIVLIFLFNLFLSSSSYCQELVSRSSSNGSGISQIVWDQTGLWFRSEDIKNMEDIFDGIRSKLIERNTVKKLSETNQSIDFYDVFSEVEGSFLYPLYIDEVKFCDLLVRVNKGRIITKFINKSKDFEKVSFDSKDKVYVERVNKTLVILSGIARASVSASSAFLTAGVNPDVGYVGSIPTAILSGTLAMGFHWFNDLYKYFLTRKSIFDPKDHSSSAVPWWKLFYIGDGIIRDVMISFPMMIMFSIACMVGEVMEGGDNFSQQLSVIYTQPIGYFTPLLLGAFSNSISEGMLSIADGNLLKHRIQNAKIHNILDESGLNHDVSHAKTTSYLNGLLISVLATSSIVLLTIPEFSSHGFTVCAGMTAFGAVATYFTELFYKWIDRKNNKIVECSKLFQE